MTAVWHTDSCDHHPGVPHCGSCMADERFDEENGTHYGPSGHEEDPCCCEDTRFHKPDSPEAYRA